MSVPGKFCYRELAFRSSLPRFFFDFAPIRSLGHIPIIPFLGSNKGVLPVCTTAAWNQSDGNRSWPTCQNLVADRKRLGALQIMDLFTHP